MSQKMLEEIVELQGGKAGEVAVTNTNHKIFIETINLFDTSR